MNNNNISDNLFSAMVRSGKTHLFRGCAEGQEWEQVPLPSRKVGLTKRISVTGQH